MSSLNKSFSFHTFGCKLNFSESSQLIKEFKNLGYNYVDETKKPDFFIINSCSVTENADNKCIQIIKKVKNNNPSCKVIVTGCFAQLKPEEIAKINGVDFVIGANEKNKINEIISNNENWKHSCNVMEIKDFQPAVSTEQRTRSFLKIQDGCDYFCSFCTIPLARGKSRSDTIDNVYNNCKELVDNGINEIVLTGVNVGDFGVKNNESFFDLIKKINLLPDLKRIKISSIEPNLLTDEIINFISKSNKFLPHFHIPLQSGSDEILKMMRRRYDTKLYYEKIRLINKLILNCSIGVDVIVGYPSETENHFLQTYNFLKDLEISYLHVFPYSERINTVAIRSKNQISPKLKKERTFILRNLSDIKKCNFYKQNQDKIFPVLFEKSKIKNEYEGFTPNYIKVKIKSQQNLTNKIVNTKLENLNIKELFFNGVLQ